MKFYIWLILAAPSLTSEMAAATVNDIAIYAVEKSRSSMFIAEQVSYTKTFEVTLKNMSEEAISLSGICIKGVSSDGKEYVMSPVENNIMKGMLQPQKTVRGILSATGDNTAIHKIILVKPSDICTNSENNTLPFTLVD
ncbi:DUF4354 family protein [Salmonella enterica]|nr:DUF4354 family protein [Salmonella enterica]EAO7713770.1 DUF4354 family protein [Salmonella enterica]EAR4440197.1 DUF4354 family protein [Salmonella enterica]EAT6896115.1 DUF4354 family protein [Salmonella enterica]EAV4982798.1 DUF4354 family protein [Salmonella enterica]